MKIPTDSLLVFRNPEEVAAAKPVLDAYFEGDDEFVAKILKNSVGLIFYNDGKFARVPEPYYFDFWKDEYNYVLVFDEEGKLIRKPKPASITRKSKI